MIKLIPLTLALAALIATGYTVQEIDFKVKNKLSGGQKVVELIGACEFLKKVDCWDMKGKRSPPLTAMVKSVAKNELQQVNLGFRSINRLVIYRTTRLPFFPKGSTGGTLDVESRSGDIWLSENRRPGEKGGRIEEEIRAQVVVAPKGTTALSIVVRETRQLPETTIPFRAGAKAKVINGTVEIVAIRAAKPAELSRSGVKKGWVVELTQGAFPTLLDEKGMPLQLSANNGSASTDSMFFLDSAGPNAMFLMTIDPARVAKVKFQGSDSRLVEVTGAPANPR